MSEENQKLIQVRFTFKHGVEKVFVCSTFKWNGSHEGVTGVTLTLANEDEFVTYISLKDILVMEHEILTNA